MAIGDYTNVIQQFYISYFGRPADPVGLRFAAEALNAAGAPPDVKGLVSAYNSNATVKQLVDNFGTSAESLSFYGAVSGAGSVSNFVTQIYINVLDRQPDRDGLLYWSNEIASGRLAASRVALAILDAATRTADATTVANKLAVAKSFTDGLDTVAEINAYSGNAAAATARELLSQVDGTTNVTAFQQNVTDSLKALVESPSGQTGSTFTLTGGVDNITGTAGSDIFDARIPTSAISAEIRLDETDSIQGGAGRDTLLVNALLDGEFTNVRNVEIVRLSPAFELGINDEVAIGAKAAAAGIDEVQLSSLGSNLDLTGFDKNVTVKGLDQQDEVLLSLADKGDKTLNLGVTTQSIDEVYVETQTATTQAGSVKVNFVSASVGNGALNSVTVTGANGKVVTEDEGISLYEIEDVDSGISDRDSFNVVGLGADGAEDPTQNRGNFSVVTLGTKAGDTLVTGQPGEVIEISSGNSSGSYYINAGEGNDTVTAFTMNANQKHFVVGGAGDDKINVTGTSTDSRVTIRAGSGDNGVTVGGSSRDVNSGTHSGTVSVTFDSGKNTVTFNNLLTLNASGTTPKDVLVGGTGIDTLAATTLALVANSSGSGPADADRSISNFEVIQVTDQFSDILTVANIQKGIGQVDLVAGTYDSSATIAFESGSKTVNIGNKTGGQLRDALFVSAAGTGSVDSLTVKNLNTKAAVLSNGQETQQSTNDRNAFNGKSLAATGFEVLTVDTGAASVKQTLDAVTVRGVASGSSDFDPATNVTTDLKLNITGANAAKVSSVFGQTNGTIVVDASGLTAQAKGTTFEIGAVTANVATTTTGSMLSAGKASVIGSAGKDVITLGSDTVTSVSAGAGDDAVTITAITKVGALDGGAGINTLSVDGSVLNAVNAFDVDQVIALNDKISNFQKLVITGPFAPALNNEFSFSVTRLDSIQDVTLNGYGDATGTSGTTFTLKGLNSGAVVTLLDGAVDPAPVISGSPNVEDSLAIVLNASGSADVATLNLSNTSDTDFGSITIANVETLNIVSSQSSASAELVRYFVEVTDAQVKTLNLSGTENIVLAGDVSDAKVISAEGMSNTVSSGTVGAFAGVDISSSGSVDQTITGGKGSDTIDAGRGLDVIKGNGGKDFFFFDEGDSGTLVTPSTIAKIDQITDFQAGALELNGVSTGADVLESVGDFEALSSSELALVAGAANLKVAVELAFSSIGETSEVTAFAYDGKTYVAANLDDEPDLLNAYTADHDFIVELVGVKVADLVDLNFANVD